MNNEKSETNSTFPKETVFCAVAILLAGGLRLFTNIFFLFNLTALGGLGLFLGGRQKSRWAFFLPLAVMFATDFLLWVHHGNDESYSLLHVSRPFIYFSFLLYVLIGRMVFSTQNPFAIGGAALLGSIQFFLVTNFHAWLDPSLGYTQDFAGLLLCYERAIPFAQPTFVSDLVFTGLFFGLHVWIIQPKMDSKPVTEGQ